jgi:hypothetical protein
MSVRYLIGVLLCSLFRHPPATWAETEKENEILRMMNTPMPPGSSVVGVEVSCMCGRKMVPFRAKPTRGVRG